MVTNNSLHHAILQHIIEKGFAPDVAGLSNLLGSNEDEVIQGLYELQDYHGVVLHPGTPKIWVIHPFSLAPTNFLVRSSKGVWWGNCAWCSLGVAALLNEDVTITTRLAAHDEQVVVHINKGELQEKNLFIHFPIPMKHAWDNVIYTCSNMLLFKDEGQVDDWCARHAIPRGDLQPLDHIWQFSKKWYGNHLDKDWKKWTMQEAKEIFASFNLDHPVWQLESSASRF